jgi:hypothetical protein
LWITTNYYGGQNESFDFQSMIILASR